MSVQTTPIQETVWIETHRCGACGIVFGMPDTYVAARRQDGKNFYCPNGHPRVFRETEEQRLRAELERRDRRLAFQEQLVREEREQRRSAERSLAATKGHVSRLRKRAAHGVCAFCNRQFANVARHVENRHPEEVHGA